jgi:type I restriction enzyme S subunit
LFLPFPPIEEQKTITNFLDNETAKIDALIAEQQRLIELLKEKRQAVISFAVTKGLNPDAPMKDSGIGWLGEVPEHWKVTPIKSLAKLFGRIGYRGYTTADIVEEGAGAITLSPSNMSDGNISLHKSTYISWEKYHESPEIKVSYGDIVMVKTGSTLGKVSLVRQQDIPAITINPQLVIFKNIVCNPLFLFYSMLAARIQSEIEVNNTGSSIPTLTQECIGNLVIPLPSLDEQQTIATFLDGEIEKLNTLTAEAKRGIELLQERRTALISAAVTGKIDVRGLVSTALPEEAAA